jgi:hypothetical protein
MSVRIKKDFDNYIIEKYMYETDVLGTFFDIKDSKGIKPLLEKNLNRMLRNLERYGAIIISAHRSEIDDGHKVYFDRWCSLHSIKNPQEKHKKEFLKWFNTRQTKSLIKDLQASNYTYVPVYGGYHDVSNPQNVDSYEVSFVVYNSRRDNKELDFEYLADFAIYLCDKYMQDSVYIQAPGEAPNYYNREGKKISNKSSKRIITNDNNQMFFTALRPHHNSQRFTSDVTFEGLYVNHKPSSIFNRMVRRAKGEMLLE